MRYLHTIFIILFFVLSIFFSFGIQETFANKYLSQISVESSSEKVKKLQEVFKWLGLYNWEVDGNFYSIRESLINYQIQNGIVPDREHYEAWYFWNKTIKSLKEKFGQDFVKLQKDFLKLEEPKIDQEGFFIVTAYYSPLPNQEKYSTGSYNAEIKLNGWWNTASWKKPTPWTIAAPRNYKFWTKIYLEGFWIWVVEDRWWAIVNSWDRWHLHDRIDLWMWYWDEARERTRRWWVRTVKWKILEPSAEVNVTFDINRSEENFTEQNKYEKKSELEDYKNLYISPENPNKMDVRMLQKLLKRVNLYTWEIDWNFDSIKQILIDFQFENWVITSKNSDEAGYFWKKTFEAFLKKFWKNFELLDNKEEFTVKKSYDSILTSTDKENIKKVREIVLKNAKMKFSGIAYNNYIQSVKNELKSLANTLNSEKKKAIIDYFIEIL